MAIYWLIVRAVQDKIKLILAFGGTGVFLGQRFLKEKRLERRKHLTVGINYGIGGVENGIPAKYESIDCYVVNQIGGFLSRNFLNYWELMIKFNYLAGSCVDRDWVFSIGDTITPEVFGWWDIFAYTPGIEVRFWRGDKFLIFGVDLYLVKAVGEYHPLSVVSRGITVGGEFGFGFDHFFNPSLGVELSVLSKMANVKNPKSSWNGRPIGIKEDFFITFTGFYLQLGFKFRRKLILLSYQYQDSEFYPPDNTMPLTLVNNKHSCWGCCILGPLGGMLFENAYRSKRKEVKEKYLSLGITYSLGTAYGKEGESGTTILLPEHLYIKECYWVNILGLTGSYNFGSSWELVGKRDRQIFFPDRPFRWNFNYYGSNVVHFCFCPQHFDEMATDEKTVHRDWCRDIFYERGGPFQKESFRSTV
ncbi:hypothetical protein DRP53_09505 [candidate division WOR-3 bacterium]|uniref:Uncharacterized protein n=1 Tax=candidate division WOR-3 bacterium TaxID=2052148 RepID=A0A660SDY3_UNCW3|nr:MAG: hypothetical protein DRP53_09505 [candidate division WOR-3 bacterium]